MIPRPGHRCPGFLFCLSRRWAVVYDHNLQATHCRHEATYTRRWFTQKGGGGAVVGVLAPPRWVDGSATVREIGKGWGGASDTGLHPVTPPAPNEAGTMGIVEGLLNCVTVKRR